MRFLKENYEGLCEIDELSQALKPILLEPAIQEALQNNDFNTLYKELPLDYASYFTHLMSSLNIDPLKYLDYIPDLFLADTTIRAINIPSHIKSIDHLAFNHCKGLTSVTIPDSVTSIGQYAFNDCINLTSITIPDSVTSIGDYAFSGCSGLRNITIPSNVMDIGYNVFARCSGLTNIIIPNSVTSISNEAFRGCSGLTSIVIPDSVTIIGDWVFSGCVELASVTIGNRVTRIGYMAFEGCRNLNYIKYMGTIDQWNKIHISSEWNGLSSIKTIHCLDGDITL